MQPYYKQFRDELKMPHWKNTINSKVIVFGLGNWYRSDDAAGLLITQKLKTKNLPGVRFIDLRDGGLSLINEWSEHDKVIIVDAVKSHSTVGTIHRFNLINENIPNDIVLFSTHTICLPGVIKLATQLHKLPAELRLFAIEGKTFSAGISVSSAILAASELVANEIVELCNNWLAGCQKT